MLCPAALSAAAFLRDHEACSLSPAQHLALLAQLLDDCLDTSLIRDMLSNRCGALQLWLLQEQHVMPSLDDIVGHSHL